MVSATDPSLAPIGSATMTVTLGAIPFRLFDGAWTHEKRDTLRARALAAAESVLPGVSASVLAAEVVAPPDIESTLGATDGDLWGGEIASDQMLDFRPGPRNEMTGLYLGGPSSAAGPLGTCAAGMAAARALLADLKAGRLK
jgi:phytoene dehydrogenase-like protein